MIEMAMEDSSKKENLEKMIESFINRVAKVISSSHANVLMLYFKDMSTNELVVDLFREKNGSIRTEDSLLELFNPDHLGVFYKVHFFYYILYSIYSFFYQLPDLLFDIS